MVLVDARQVFGAKTKGFVGRRRRKSGEKRATVKKIERLFSSPRSPAPSRPPLFVPPSFLFLLLSFRTKCLATFPVPHFTSLVPDQLQSAILSFHQSFNPPFFQSAKLDLAQSPAIRLIASLSALAIASSARSASASRRSSSASTEAPAAAALAAATSCAAAARASAASDRASRAASAASSLAAASSAAHFLSLSATEETAASRCGSGCRRRPPCCCAGEERGGSPPASCSSGSSPPRRRPRSP